MGLKKEQRNKKKRSEDGQQDGGGDDQELVFGEKGDHEVADVRFERVGGDEAELAHQPFFEELPNQ